MNGLNDFLTRLNEDLDEVGKEDVSKNLAKEDALKMIADFVKDVKIKFGKAADRSEILEAASKTLRFYIDEIDSEEFAASLSVGASFTPPEMSAEPIPTGNDFDDEEDNEDM